MLRRSARMLCPTIGFESVGKHGRLVTLQREKALNALNGPMIEALRSVYTELGAEPAKSVVVVMKGAGSKAFCAGGDVVSLVKDQPPGSRQRFFYEEYQVDNMVAQLQQPHVALWDGIVMGGGVGISVHGSHRVASEAAMFAMPETGIGLFPDVGGSWCLPRLKHEGMGMYLALTGARLKGADVVHAGLATHYVARDRMAELEKALLEATAASRSAVSATIDAHSTLELKPFSLCDKLGLIQKHFGSHHGSVEAICASLDGDSCDWAQATAKTLSKMSPSSLKVSFECQRRAALHENIEQTFHMEYYVSQRCMATKDFDAGVSALLIDKTGSPVWAPATLDGVTADLVEAHFKPTAGSPDWHPTAPFPTPAKL